MMIRTFPYFVFEGQAEAAYHFYGDILGAEKVGLVYFSDYHEDTDEIVNFKKEGIAELVMNAELKLTDGSTIMFSDNYPGMPFKPGNTINLSVEFDHSDDTQQVFNQLADGGSVTMELQETSWSPAYGTLTDKFGVDWQVTTAPADA